MGCNCELDKIKLQFIWKKKHKQTLQEIMKKDYSDSRDLS